MGLSRLYISTSTCRVGDVEVHRITGIGGRAVGGREERVPA